MMIGTRQLAQHERVKPIRLPARSAKPRTRRGDLVGMQRQHPQPRVQQPLDQQPVGPLDRDQPHPQPHQLRHTATAAPARRARTSRPAASRPSHQRRARRASPTPNQRRRNYFPSELPLLSWSGHFTAPRPRGTVAGAHRQALNMGLRPVAACGTSPPPGGAGPLMALHTGQATRGPLPAVVEATTRMKLLCQAPPCEMVARGHRSLSRGAAARLRCARSCRTNSLTARRPRTVMQLGGAGRARRGRGSSGGRSRRRGGA